MTPEQIELLFQTLTLLADVAVNGRTFGNQNEGLRVLRALLAATPRCAAR